MKPRVALFLTELKLSLRTLGWLYAKWQYTLLGVIAGVTFFEAIYWLFNLPVLTTVIFSGLLTLTEKATVLASPFTAVSGVSSTFMFGMMLLVADIQGFSIAALTYAIRHQARGEGKLIGGSTVTALLAMIGIGCPACGTSLLTPIIAFFASSSAVSISEQMTSVALPLAAIIGLYGLYAIGLRISTIRVMQEIKSSPVGTESF